MDKFTTTYDGKTYKVRVEAVLWEERYATGDAGLPTPWEVPTESVRDHFAGVLFDSDETTVETAYRVADVMAAEWVARFGRVF